ncbi:MAG TPA: riboflavin synthase [Caulobacterales bacterium]|nr:riboflavin synthase [Caulobacterales bacterium]
MFTGIVSAIGEVRAVNAGAVTRFEIASPYDPAGVDIGASISHAGACLTVVERRAEGAGMIHTVEAVPETLAKTTLGGWREGTKINLERALRAGDELGGHLVAGHIDGVGRVKALMPAGGSIILSVETQADLAALIAPKGSIAIDGVSLTVVEVGANAFSIALIPHTSLVTTLGTLKVDDMVNLEIDLLARYVARLLDARKGTS